MNTIKISKNYKRIVSLICTITMLLPIICSISVYAAPKVYYQSGQSWSSYQYGLGPSGSKATIGSSGCALLSLTNAIYHLNGSFISPTTLADFSVNNGYRVNGVGTSHSFFKGAATKYGDEYGFKYNKVVTSTSDLKSHLQNGGVATCVQPGHFMAITEYDSSSNKYLLLDSYPSSNRGTSKGYAWKTATQLKDSLGITKYFLLSSIKPATPKISSVSATGDDAITIKWNSVSGADKYILQGRKAGDSYATIAELTGTSYTHKNLDVGCLYWYRVQTKIGSSKSNYSSASAAYTKPKTPTSSVSDSTVNSIKVNWTTGADGASHYELLARKSGEEEYTTVAKNITANTYTHTGLEAGTQYYYKIKAYNQDKTSIVSGYSDEGSGFTKLKAPTATSKTAKTVSLSWSRGKLNGAHTYTYRVRRKTSDASAYTNVAVVSSTSYKDSGLKPGTTYHYYIQVLRNGSYIVGSSVLTVTTNTQLAESISVSPKNVTVTEGDQYTLTAKVLPSDTTNKSVTWTSNNTNVATVSTKGIITAKSKGTAKITVKTSNGLTAVCTVTVESLQDSCAHSYGSWTITRRATCTDDGYMYRRCDLCDKAEGKNIPATDHSFSDKWTITKEATCKESGERKHLCTSCGEPDVSTVESTGLIAHISDEEWIIATEPTCSETGLRFKTCLVCNEKCEAEEISTIAHEYTENWVVAQKATCQQEKIEYRSCANCDEKEFRYEDKTEHDYVATDVKDSTYQEEGYVTYFCSYCEDSYTDIIPMLTNDDEIEGDGGDNEGDGTLSPPITATTYKKLTSSYKFYIEVSQELHEEFLAVAVYDENGKLLSVARVACDGDTFYTASVPLNTDISYAKIFVWQDLVSLKPIAGGEMVKITQ